MSKAHRKVLLVELNEITWRWLDPLCAAGKLPAFAELLRGGTRGAPVATEEPPHLDPWISWTSVYTGRPQEEHGVHFLEQPPETVQGPRIWDLAAEAGRSLGIYGSIMSWPPRRDIRGFWVPSTFSPTAETYPPDLQPIQDLNLGQTRAHTPLSRGGKAIQMAKLVANLLPLGLRLRTLLRLAAFMVRSRLQPHRAWEKVSYQPLVNLDFFEKLYRQHQPDLATFHTNHVAHYQHRFWRYADPSPFPIPPTPTDCRRFGPSIEFGYRVADETLARLMELAGPDTVVIVASGLGQQPFVKDDFPEGRRIYRVRDIRQIIERCGLTGHCEALSMMAPQWNLRVPDPQRRAHAESVLSGAWAGLPGTKLFAHVTRGDTINFNLQQNALHGLDPRTPCGFPDSDQTLALGDLCTSQDATPKQGYHDPVGVVILRGPGIRAGGRITECSNLDLAPTILQLLGLPIPTHMNGRVLTEALESAAPANDQSMMIS